MVPTAYMRLDSLPLTPNGKLDRRALPAPEQDAYSARGYEAPQGEIESYWPPSGPRCSSSERVGRHDNFFALGGHSLVILQLINLINQMNLKISVAEVFECPTIESMSRKIGLRTTLFPPHNAILIRKGTTELPLFFAHEGTGQFLYVHALAPYVDDRVPLYALPPKAADETQLLTVEAMAARMVRMMRSVQPSGPYRIAGWSFGGTLAYEIATQLIGADQRVDFLGMLDTNYPAGLNSSHNKIAVIFDAREQLLLLIQAIANRGDDSQATIATLISKSHEMNFEALVQEVGKLSLMPALFNGATPAQIHYWLARTHANGLASMSYSAEQIPISVRLFSTSKGATANHALGWNAVVPDTLLRIVKISGTHHTMLESPNVKGLGEAISREMRYAALDAKDIHEKHYSPLFTLQTGRGNGRTPLFCIPGAGGNVTVFDELTSCLDKHWSVYGLQPRGVDGILVPHSTVLAASESYLRAIEERYAKGPIHLLGHSFGGWVAFDLAQRLCDAGRQVVSLTILDSLSPDSQSTAVREYSRIEVIMAMVDIFEQLVGYSLHLERDELDSRSEIEQITILHDRLVRASIMPRGSEPDVLRGPLRVFGMALRADYIPEKAYPGPVQLVLAKDERLDQDVNQRKHACTIDLWCRWAPNLVFVQAPGNHMTMLTSPLVSELVHLLNLA